MKVLPLLLLPFLTAPVNAESIGDRSNRQAYRDAQQTACRCVKILEKQKNKPRDKNEDKKEISFEHDELPDPIQNSIQNLDNRIQDLEKKIKDGENPSQ